MGTIKNLINKRNYCLCATILLGLLAGCQREQQFEIIRFSNYSTVNWAQIDTMYYRPCTADWNDDIDRRIDPDFPLDIAAEYWHSLQNAKTYFHQRSLPIRAVASQRVWKSLDRTEAAFDTVFVRCVEQEYYMRLLVDVYNEIMPPAIDNLCRTMAAEKN